jgi:hypothetical protein
LTSTSPAHDGNPALSSTPFDDRLDRDDKSRGPPEGSP